MSGVIAYPDYLGDSDADVIDRAFERIVKALNSRDARFLIGAGMSATSNVPTGSGLLEQLLRIYFPESGARAPSGERLASLALEFPFEVVMEAIQNNLGVSRQDMTEHLKSILLDPKYVPSQAHHDFLSICFWGGSSRVDQVFTTNYDLLIEQAMGQDRAVTITEKNARQLRKAQSDGLIPILHLHGLLDEEFQLTETDVYRDNFSSLSSEFRTALGYSDAFVFIGYSMNDPDFRSVYMNYRREIVTRRQVDKKTYVVSPAKDGHSYRLGKEVWKARGADWIPLDASSFLARLKQLLEYHADRDARARVKEKFELEDEEALNELIERTAGALRVDSSEALQFLSDTRKRGGGK
jgi:hypothetical protein